MESAASVRTAVLWEIVEESLEEAEFLWARWERLLDAPDRDLEGIWFWAEERLAGALDGIVAGGGGVVEPLLVPALASDDAGRVSSAACALVRLGTSDALATLRKAVEGFVGPSLHAVVRGLGRVAPADLLAQLASLLRTGEPATRAAILELHRWRRIPVDAALLRGCLAFPEKDVRAAAFRAARYSPPHEVAALLDWGLRDDDPDVSAAAVETGVVLNVPSAGDRLSDLVHERGLGVPPPLLTLFALAGNPQARRILLSLLAEGPPNPGVLAAVAMLGQRSSVEALLATLAGAPPLQVKLVGDAICAITGARLHEEALLAEPRPPAEPPSFEAEDMSADLVPAPGDELPEPDPARLAAWWQKHERRFPEGPRFVSGQAATFATLLGGLSTAPMRRRHALALELAIRSGGTFIVETRGFVAEQRRQLSATPDLRSWPRSPLPGWAPLN
jgi:uncharacterized protein (TIGR02270 family)